MFWVIQHQARHTIQRFSSHLIHFCVISITLKLPFLVTFHKDSVRCFFENGGLLSTRYARRDRYARSKRYDIRFRYSSKLFFRNAVRKWNVFRYLTWNERPEKFRFSAEPSKFPFPAAMASGQEETYFWSADILCWGEIDLVRWKTSDLQFSVETLHRKEASTTECSLHVG